MIERDDALTRLDRDLSAALDVSPSPDLLPRVRERLVRRDARPNFALYVGVAAASAATLVVLVVLTPRDVPQEPDDVVAATEVVPQSPRRASSSSETTSERPPVSAPAAPVAVSSRDHLRPSSDLAAIEQLVETLDAGTVDIGSLSDLQDESVPIMELSIMPLEVPALSSFE